MEHGVHSDSSSTSIAEQLVEAVQRAELQTDPFDYIYMNQVFDGATYSKLLGAMPDRRFYHGLMHQDAVRTDGSSTRLRMYLYPELLNRLPKEQRTAWMSVAQALCSPELERAFKRKFGRVLEQRFGRPADDIGLYPVPILLRDQPGYRIGIHSDVRKKAITVQFYLPENDLQRHIGTLFHESNSGPGAERTTQMPFLPSTGYAFPVSLTKSWHSASATRPNDGERVSMMVTYYVANTPLQRIRWRLRRALLSLGIHSKH